MPPGSGEAMMNYVERIKEHLERTDAALNYLDSAIDRAVAMTDAAMNSTAALRAKFEFVLCIFSAAPIDKISACVSGGGLAFVVLSSATQLIAAATIRTKSIVGAQVLSCSPTSARVRYADGREADVPNPAKVITMVALFWVGG